MIDNIKKILNENQDPKAIEKITSKLTDILMKNEEVGYIGVQKKPVTVMPDSIVLTNKRIIVCRPKNLGLSMDYFDYDWNDIDAVIVKENILGSEISFSTKSDLSIFIDYIPKSQARKIATFAKEQLDAQNTTLQNKTDLQTTHTEIGDNIIDQIIVETETVASFIELMPNNHQNFENNIQQNMSSNTLSQDALFEKLQNYKKLLDNGLILQGEYDALKKEILSHM